MFTWIIENKAKILEIKNWRFKVENVFGIDDLVIWQSIAHDWACMTLECFDEEFWEVFVMSESLKKTNFSTKKTWDFFNIERCLKLWDRLDWHMVSGHIDWTWEIIWIDNIKDWSKILKIIFDTKFNNLLIDKWSITVNWVSLTIVETWDDFFTISLIPLTQNITNLWDLENWDKVNLEFDMIWKYVNKLNS
jgi:riboflavin synthase